MNRNELMNVREFIEASFNMKKLIDDYKFCEDNSIQERIESEGEDKDNLDDNKDDDQDKVNE